MSEPRKSLRATKGINPKIDHLDTPGDMNKKGTARKVTKKKAAEAAQEEEEEEVIRCVCGADSTDEDSGEAWIACDKCGVWQHNVCVGVSTFEDEIPAGYLCEIHDPEFHKELLNSMKAGKKIWEDRQKELKRRIAQEEAAKKKGKKGGARKSDVGTNGKTSISTPQPEVKRGTPAKEVSSSKRKDMHDKDTPKESKPKIRKVTTPPVQQKTPPTEQPLRIDNLEHKRQGAAKLIYKSLLQIIPVAIEKGIFAYLGDDNLETKAERLSCQVEKAVFETHPYDSYIKQCRAIAANLKTNQELSNGLLVKTLNPLALAGLSSDDMATQELKQETAAMKARADKQAIMLTEEGPRIRRTHKGEEIIEADDHAVANDSTMATSRRRSMLDPNADMAIRSRENSPGDQVELPDMEQHRSRDDIRSHVIPKQPLNIDTKAPPIRRQSTHPDFDINKVFSSVQSPTGPPSQIRRPSAYSPQPRAPGNDPDIDKLLQDDEGMESPPYSPAEYSSDPDVVWGGSMIMDSIATFPGSAKHVGGADLTKTANPPVPWSNILSKELRVAGRIDLEKANEYLCSLRYSPYTDIVIIQVTPTNREEEFMTIFNYFHSKNRYGVLTNKAIGNIRDTYLIPVGRSPEPLPDFMRNLEYNKLPEERTEPSLLVALVIRSDWQPDPPGFDGSFDAQAGPIPANPQFQHRSLPPVQPVPGPSMSPFIPQNSSFGPAQTAPPTAQQQPQQDQVRPVKLEEGEAKARRILGHRANDPTVGFLMPNAADMRDLEWEVIRDILESDERARTDLIHLSSRLERGIQEQEASIPR